MNQVVRKLRVTVPSGSAEAQSPLMSSIDAVDNPLMLAHRLMQLEALKEDRSYGRRLRMSQMHKLCVRAELLGLRNNVSYTETVAPSLRFTFDIGNAIHLFLQNCEGYLGVHRFGWWRCTACGVRFFGRKPVKKCQSCGANPEAFRYYEHALHMPDGIPVSGHPDEFLEVAPGDIRIVDFKTINGEDFAKLEAPLPDHCIQVNGYMHYIQYDKSIPISVNTERGFLLYISKKYTPRSIPFKMFHVTRDSMFLDPILQKVETFKHGLEDEKFLPEPYHDCVNTEFSSGRAKYCPVSIYCRGAFCSRLQNN